MTSSKLGIERRTILVEDVLDFPVVPFEILTKDQVRRVRNVAEMFSSPNGNAFRALSRLVRELYGLSDADQEVIKDTLAVRMPYSDSRAAAEAPPSVEQIRAFCARMEGILCPLFKLTRNTLRVKFRDHQPSTAWRFLDVLGDTSNGQSEKCDLVRMLSRALAEKTGSSRIFIPAATGYLMVGILAQYRYWTLSRARLCALDILREYEDHLQGHAR